MHYVTLHVLPDEPCYGLAERPMMRALPDGSRQWRWVQQVFVVRDDTISKYETDFGPAENFRDITPMVMPSHGTDTVAQLQEFAARNRQDDYWQKEAQAQQAESTLITDHIRQFEQIHEVLRNRSTFGPAQSTQRNGYSDVTFQRGLIQQKRERTGKVQL